MTPALFVAVVGASLIGSLHCAAMCGGFVAAYVDAPGYEKPGRLGRVFSHLGYNLGRLATYVAFGAVAGTIGRTLNLAASAAGVGKVAAVATGVLLVAMGIVRLSRNRADLITLGRRPTKRGALYPTRLLVAFARRPAPVRAVVLGLASTLLPCGWLYAFVLSAAGTGSALGGASLMAGFWLGSLPIMMCLGVSLEFLSATLKRHIPRVSAALMIAVGLTTLLIRANAFGVTPTKTSLHDSATTQAPVESCPFHSGARAMPAGSGQ